MKSITSAHKIIIVGRTGMLSLALTKRFVFIGHQVALISYRASEGGHEEKLKLTRLPVVLAEVMAAVIGSFHPGIKRLIKVAVDSEARYEPFNVRPLLQKIPIQIKRIIDFIRNG
ncbi:MAG: hypothetical protein M3R25_10835 [Bacteroidota bacterium]|nr:hypothetical protein [Bacteroidota bacterium]